MSELPHNDSYFEDDYPEEPRTYSTHIVGRRFYVFLEVFMAMLFNFLFYIGLGAIESYIPDWDYRGLIFYGAQMLMLLLSIVLSLVFSHFVFYKNKIPLKNADPPLKETASLFSFNKFGMQIVFTLLILFLVYVPLDFLTYMIPGSLDYSRRSLVENDVFGVNAYLNFSQFGSFILFSSLLHLMVGIREETFFRGYLSMRSEKYLNPGSTVVITSMYFGLAHLGYIFSSSSQIPQDLIPALVWTLGGFLVGSVSAVFILKKRMIWPIIFAHSLNNIISSSVIWLTSIQNVNFWDLAKWLYLPLLAITVLLLAIFFREVKIGIIDYFKTFGSYKNEIADQKVRGKILLADIFFGLLFWAVGIWFI